MNIKEIGNLSFYCEDLDQDITIKNYLKKLLLTLWEEVDGFSGKRPFGNSDWYDDIYLCLVENQIIEGKIDENGYLEDCDGEAGDTVINELINSL